MVNKVCFEVLVKIVTMARAVIVKNHLDISLGEKVAYTALLEMP